MNAALPTIIAILVIGLIVFAWGLGWFTCGCTSSGCGSFNCKCFGGAHSNAFTACSKSS
jgi:hypothetical protein